MKIEKVLYTAKAQSTGGREGSSKTDDGRLDLVLSTPKELGGAGKDGTNPEQLFAAGYSACFLGAIKFVAAQGKIALSPETTVAAQIGIGQIPTGFGIEAELTIHIPGVDLDTAKTLVEKAHIVCPYSAATRGNIEVKLNVV